MKNLYELTLILALSGCVSGQSASDPNNRDDTLVYDGEFEVSHAERMTYPLGARLRMVQGVVVVRVHVRADGTVNSAKPIFGPELLVEDTITNAKKWRFSYATKDTAIIVYQFKITGVCELPCLSNFEFYPSNLVVISTGRPLMMP